MSDITVKLNIEDQTAKPKPVQDKSADPKAFDVEFVLKVATASIVAIAAGLPLLGLSNERIQRAIRTDTGRFEIVAVLIGISLTALALAAIFEPGTVRTSVAVLGLTVGILAVGLLFNTATRVDSLTERPAGTRTLSWLIFTSICCTTGHPRSISRR